MAISDWFTQGMSGWKLFATGAAKVIAGAEIATAGVVVGTALVATAPASTLLKL